MKIRNRFVTSLPLAAAILCSFSAFTAIDLPAALARNSGNDDGVRAGRVEGFAVRINVSTRLVVVELRNGGIRRLSVPTTAKVERNNVHATLAAFALGDFVQARLNASGVVTKIEAAGP